MKIIHCSDLHLDSGTESNLSAAKVQERNVEICKTFSRMADYAADNGVRAVMITGDLFDGGRVTSRTADSILSVIERRSAIDFLYLRGKSDQFARPFLGRDLPENLKTFSDKWTHYRYGDIDICGAETTDDNFSTVYRELILRKNCVNIVMMYGEKSERCEPGLICLPKLRRKNVAYLALGGRHAYEADRLSQTGVCCYSGCLEGRNFDERGEKGFVFLEVEGGKVSYEFVPFAKRTLVDVPVDISGRLTVRDIQQAMEEAAADVPADCLIRFILQGDYTLETQKDFRALLKVMELQYYSVEIKDESRLHVSRDLYEHDISLKGEFIRTVMASEKSDKEKEEMIRFGFQALSGKEIIL